MQFITKQLEENQMKRVTFKFYERLGIKAKSKFKEIFKHLGASRITDNSWYFPVHVQDETISVIIKNTCFVCGGLMLNSAAYDNTFVSFNDFGEDAGKRGTTQSKSGKAKLIPVRKCVSCGHSHT